MIVSDEMVVEALLKDAKRFKSKWELHSNEPIRSRPNVKFLQRTINNLVKTNEDRLRRPKSVESVKRNLEASKSETIKEKRISEPSRQTPEKATNPKRHSRKSEYCKSKHRSPERQHKSSTSHHSKRKRKKV